MSELKFIVSDHVSDAAQVKNLLDGDGVTSLGTEVVELLNHTLVAVGILAQRVDNPELTQVHGSGNSSGFGVTGDELDILDTATLGGSENCQRGHGRDDLHWGW